MASIGGVALVDVALLLLAVAFLLGVLRGALGPRVADRAIAADVCLFAVASALALLAVRSGSEAFLDVVLIAALLGFIATIALAALVNVRSL
ncbi:MAG: monovalent cation/H+ antiporter complex subunit F [Actinomycetota bacterium]